MLYVAGFRRVHGNGGVASCHPLLSGMEEIRPHQHGESVVRVGSERQAASAGRLFGLQQDRRRGSVPSDGRGQAVLGGVHGAGGHAQGQAQSFGLHGRAEGTVLQAAILRQLQGNGLGRLDHRSQRILRQLLSRRLWRLPHSRHFRQPLHSRHRGIPENGPALRYATLLRPIEVFVNVINIF